MSIYDRLQGSIGGDDEATLSPAVLLSLDMESVSILRHLVRNGGTPEPDLVEIAGSPEAFSAALAQLREQGLVTLVGESEPPTWRAELGRRKARVLPGGLWARLGDSLVEPESGVPVAEDN